jgi:hypothetical protein
MDREYGVNDGAKLFDDLNLMRCVRLMKCRHIYDIEGDIFSILYHLREKLSKMSRGIVYYLWEDLRSRLVEYRNIFNQTGSESFSGILCNAVSKNINEIDDLLFPGVYQPLELVEEEVISPSSIELDGW